MWSTSVRPCPVTQGVPAHARSRVAFLARGTRRVLQDAARSVDRRALHLTWAALAALVFTCGTTQSHAQSALYAMPPVGSVYKEFWVTMPVNNQNLWRVTHPNSTFPSPSGCTNCPPAFLPNDCLAIPGVDLTGAISAQLEVDLWGGHVGTINKAFRFNSSPCGGQNHAWIPIPELATTPSSPQCYVYQTNITINVPLGQLVNGTNFLQGTCGNQVGCPGIFNWGQFGWYMALLRVYYNPATKPHTTGSISSHATGGNLTGNPTGVSVSASVNGAANRVEFFSFCNAYDVDGDGVYVDWQRNRHINLPSENGNVITKGHIGTVTGSGPYNATWDTSRIPDQSPGSVRLRCHIRHSSGTWYVSPDVTGLSLVRPGVSYKLYKATNVPQNFWVRAGQIKSCNFTIPAGDNLSTATGAWLMINTWNGIDGQAESGQGHWTKLNRNTAVEWTAPNYGRDHFFSHDVVPIFTSGPVRGLQSGTNTFSVFSQSSHHGIEALWPGPSVLVRFPASGGGGTTPPAAPSGLTATTQPGQIQLGWSGAGATYNVYRSTTTGFTPAVANRIATGVAVTSYLDMGLPAATTFHYKVTALNATQQESTPSSQVSATTPAGSGGSCSGFLNQLPGRLEVENYRLGGQNVAYFDTTAGNQFGACRNDDVDLGGTGNCVVGSIAAGEWIEYCVAIAASGLYDVIVRHASGGSGGRLRLFLDGVAITPELATPGTGNWGVYEDLVVPDVALPEGEHVLRVLMTKAGFNLDRIDIEGEAAPPAPAPVITTTTLAPVVTGTSVSQPLAVTGGVAPLAWRVTQLAQLPPGITLNAATGVLQGTPTARGNYCFTVEVCDALLRCDTQELCLEVLCGGCIEDPAITTPMALPAAQLGVNYQSCLAATCGTGALTWTLVQPNSLPMGLGLNSNTGCITGTPAQAGLFQFEVQACDTCPNCDVEVFSLMVGAASPCSGTLTQLPGMLEVSHYRNGGPGVAYFDTTAANLFGGCRDGGVDLGGGPVDCVIGAIVATEWVEYCVSIEPADSYDLIVHHASGSSGGRLHIEIDGVNKTGTIQTNGTGSWGNYQELLVPDLVLPPGFHVLRIYMLSGGYNLDGLEFVAHGSGGGVPPQIETQSLPDATLGQPYSRTLQASGGMTPYDWAPLEPLPAGLGLNSATGVLSGTPTELGTTCFLIEVCGADGLCSEHELCLNVIAANPCSGVLTQLPGRIEIELYRNGGQGVAYHDTTPGNQYGACRAGDVDIGSSICVIGAIAPGEWVEYCTQVAPAASYTLTVRYAAGGGGGRLRVETGGSAVTGSLVLPGTGGWGTYQTRSFPGIALPSGAHGLRFLFETSGFNIDWFEFTAVGSP